jgi:hypothetical protein
MVGKGNPTVTTVVARGGPRRRAGRKSVPPFTGALEKKSTETLTLRERGWIKKEMNRFRIGT